MIELPEAVHLASQLSETVQGKQITRVVAGATPHKFAFFAEDPAGYEALLQGKAFGPARNVAAYIGMQTEDGIVLRLGEGPQLRYHAPGTALPQKHQLLIQFADGSALSATVRMYAVLWVFPEGTMESPYHHVALTKPSPLGDGFTEEYFTALVAGAKQTLSAKALLATEQRIPGLGNGVLQDILLRAGIHPKRKTATLAPPDVSRLYHSVRDTLAEMTAKGGRNTEKDLFGKPGGYLTLLSAKTWQYPCVQCGGPIQKQAYLGGSIYACPHCQPL